MILGQAAEQPSTQQTADRAVTGAVAAAVVPGFIMGLVNRNRHPIVWWGLGVLPLALATTRVVRALGKKETAP